MIQTIHRKKRILNFLSLTMFTFAALDFANAGTGWVGNSPLFTATNDASFAFASTGLSSIDGTTAPKQNPLVLRKGHSRLSIGFGEGAPTYTETDDIYQSIQGIFGFDYGLSDRWTLLNLSAFAYDLQLFKDSPHHFALYFGLIKGLGWGTSSGFSAGPGFGLLHARSWDKWAMTSSLNFAGNYHSKKSDYLPIDYNWDNAFLRLRFNFSRQLGEKWALGFGAESIVGEYTSVSLIYDRDEKGNITAFNGHNVERKKEKAFLLANPSLSLSRRLLDKGTLTWTLGFNERDSIAANPNVGSYVSLSTEW